MLVLDDDFDTADTTTQLIAAGGFDTRSASTCTDALVLVSTFRPAVLVLDLRLPHGDGYGLTARLERVLGSAAGGHGDRGTGWSRSTGRHSSTAICSSRWHRRCYSIASPKPPEPVMLSASVVHFPCPHCLRQLKAAAAVVGRTTACPACGRALVVPPPPPRVSDDTQPNGYIPLPDPLTTGERPSVQPYDPAAGG